MSILINTHGGLGNQLFQTFYALNIAEKTGKNIFLNHLAYYKHGFDLQLPINLLDIREPSTMQYLLMHTRLAKVSEKFKFSFGEIKLLNHIMLDGYFQDPDIYSEFSAKTYKKSINKLRCALNITSMQGSADLLHMRLGDFFKNEEQKVKQIEKSLQGAVLGQHVITNEEDLLLSEHFKPVMDKKKLTVIKTGNHSGIELLRLFANYRKITSNGSTLALWAAILSGANLEINNRILERFYQFHRKRIND